MNNKELEKNFNEILDEQNFFDMLLKAKSFEKEYKGSAFYKETRLDLYQALKMFKIYTSFSFINLSQKIQDIINNLDMSNLEGLLNQVEATFMNENQDTLELLNKFKTEIK